MLANKSAVAEVIQATTRANEKREHRRASLGPLHERITSIAAARFHIPLTQAVESLLDPGCLEVVNTFIQCSQAATCLAIYPAHSKQKSVTIGRLIYGDPAEAYAANMSLYLVRCAADEALTEDNFMETVHSLCLRKDQRFFKPLYDAVKDIFFEALKRQADLLIKRKHNGGRNFISEVEDYLSSLECASTCFNENVRLTPCQGTGAENIRDNARFMELSQNLTSLGLVEECACRWMQQISVEIRRLQLVREECATDGPHSEVQFWRRRTVRLNSLINQLKSREVKNVVTILKNAQSKVLGAWHDLEGTVLTAFTEAKENVRYLQVIQRQCFALYHCKIPELKSYMHSLMRMLRLIFSYSTHYRSPTNMTILFMKITKQLIKRCMEYLTENGMVSIWNQPIDVMLTKLNYCVSLNESYQAAYDEISQEDDPKGKYTKMEFSRIQIFGDFDSFITRVKALTFIMENLQKYTAIEHLAVEERTELLEHLSKLRGDFSSKPHDYLSANSSQFTKGLTNFTEGIRCLEQKVETAFNQYAQRGNSVHFCLLRLQRLESVDLPLRGQLQRYRRLFTAFRTEMEEIATAYTLYCEVPPLDRGMPPFAGRIAWARRYYMRLSHPMSMFWNHVPSLRDTKEIYKGIARYNRVAQVLVAYEILTYRNWKLQLKHQIQGLGAPLLAIVKTDDKRDEVVNLDPNLTALFREAVCMDRYGCPIPNLARQVFQRSQFIKIRRNKLQDMLTRVNSLFKRMTPEMEKILTVRLYAFYRTYYRGFYEHDWCSSVAEHWMQEVESEVDQLNALLDRAADVFNNQIDAVIKKIANYTLIELPEPPDIVEANNGPITEHDVIFDQDSTVFTAGSASRLYQPHKSPWRSSAWDVYTLVRTIHRSTLFGAVQIQTMSKSVEEAANQYISMIAGDFYEHLQRFGNPAKSAFESENEDDGDVVMFGSRGLASSVEDRRDIRIPFVTSQGPSEAIRRQKLITKIYSAIDELLRSFGQKTLDAVITTVRSALEDVWRYFGMREAGGLLKDVPVGHRVKAGPVRPRPVVQCEVVLMNERLTLRPSLEEIQTAIRAIIGCCLTCTKYIGKWNESSQRAEHLLTPGLRNLMARLPVSRVLPNKMNSTPGEGRREASMYDRRSLVLMHSATTFLNTGRQKTSDSTLDRSSLNDASSEHKRGRRATGSGESAKDFDPLDLIELEANCFQDVRHDREVYRMQTMLITWQNTMKRILFLPRGLIKELKTITEPLELFSQLWTLTPERNMENFLRDYETPNLSDFESKFQEFLEVESKLDRLYNLYIVGPLEVLTDSFRRSAQQCLLEHKQIFMCKCIELFVTHVQPMAAQIDEYDRSILRPIGNIDDISYAIEALTKFRANEVSMDMNLLQAEETQAMLNRYGMELPQELTERIESTRWAFTRLVDKMAEAVDRIGEMQQSLQQDLVESGMKLRQRVQSFMTEYDKRGPMTPGLTHYEAFDRQLLFRSTHEQIMRKVESCARAERLFGLSPIADDGLRNIGQQLDLLQHLYGLYSEVNRSTEAFAYTLWREVDVHKLREKLTELLHKCQHLPKALKHWPAYAELENKLGELVSKLPLLNSLRNPAMKARHWSQIEELIGVDKLNPEVADVTLGTMLSLPIAPSDGFVREQVEEICLGAIREKDIETKLNLITVEWAQQQLEFVPFKKRGNLLLRKERVHELIQQLEGSMVVLATLSNNRYNTQFRGRIQHWVHSLSTTCEILETWSQVQSLWVYLEAVFIGNDLAKQLPKEARSFYNIDRNWVRLMERAWDTPQVVNYCTTDASLHELLPRLLEQLEACRRSLSSYLERRRYIFPRFFFVSDAVLLEMLGQAADPRSVQKHLMGVFTNTERLIFSDHSVCDTIVAVHSTEGEQLMLHRPVVCQGPVESWISQLLQSMQATINFLFRSGCNAASEEDFQILPLLDLNPAQVGVLVLQFLWTRDAGQSLDGLRQNPKSTQHARKKFQYILERLIGRIAEDINVVERTKYEIFITMHLHQKETFDQLCKAGVRTSNDFEWTKQTRVYYREDLNKCVVSITDVDFEYQNEFIGCLERLVVTPLTDKCYIALAHALSLGFGGSLAGPSGTGKTETIKDMGHCVGQYVVVFNSSDQVDAHGINRIFKGLVQAGVWCSFDDYDRLDLSMLSVTAQLTAAVLQAKRDMKPTFMFPDGDTLSVNQEFGIFTTTSPNYAGRRQLPENAKVCFRVIAVMVPDRQTIIRVKLAANGFSDHASLASRFHHLYQMCEDQLSKRVHYDFGLRSVLSALRNLGTNRRTHKDQSEEQIMMRVLRDMNLDKLVGQDEALFLALLEQMFPGGTFDTAKSESDIGCILRSQVIQAGLTPHEPWLTKVQNLFELQRVQHGLIVLGPSGSGKSKGISILLRSLTEQGQPHREQRMNPKAVTVSDMFGSYDVLSHDWTDGIFTFIWRRTLRLKPSDYCWLVLDGPVDASWAENLNSVLDNNKILSLANGDRIPMAPNCKIVFEVDNLDNASPATISRNGVVYFGNATLTWSAVFLSWLQTRSEFVRSVVEPMVNNLFPPLITCIEMDPAVKIPHPVVFYIRQFCDLFSGLSVDQTDNAIRLTNLTLFCLAWSCGGLLDSDGRKKLDHQIRELCADACLPTSDNQTSLFDFKVSEQGGWIPWTECVGPYIHQAPHNHLYNTIVPNEDTVATQYLLQAIGKQNKPVLLMGACGTGKTTIIRNYLNQFDPDLYSNTAYSFSSSTTPVMLQQALETVIERRVGSTYGPAGGKRLTLFIDDINMPSVNEYSYQAPNELVRQLIEMKGVYSLDKAGEFLSIMDVQIMAAMRTHGGDRMDIPCRLKGQFCMFNTTLPSRMTLDHIFGTIVSNYISAESGFRQDVADLMRRLVSVTRIIWEQTNMHLRPTPKRFHYAFNLRDLTRIWQGIVGIDKKVCTETLIAFRLWQHEVRRVLAARLASVDDRRWFESTMARALEKELNDHLSDNITQEIFLVDFIRGRPDTQRQEDSSMEVESGENLPPNTCEAVADIKELASRFVLLQHELNERSGGQTFELVFFDDAIRHLVRVLRAIRNPNGHILLVGVTGSGKRSIARLGSQIAGYELFEPPVCGESHTHIFTEELKRLYLRAVKKNAGCLMLLTDDQLREEECYEYLNQILTTGFVPNLFKREELEELLARIEDSTSASHSSKVWSYHELFELYRSRVGDHLHVALCFSPVGETFRKHAMGYPGILTGCAIDWFDEWPHEALFDVARCFLAEFPPVNESCLNAVTNIHTSVTTACVEYHHQYGRKISVTSETFFTYLEAIKKTYDEFSDKLHSSIQRMDCGAEKLHDAQHTIDEYHATLEHINTELREATQREERVLRRVTEQALVTEQVRNQVLRLKHKCEVIEQRISTVRLAALEELQALRPALLEVEEALSTLRPQDILMLRKIQKPPYLLTRIMDCVLIMLYSRLEPVVRDPERGSFASSWDQAVRLMLNPNFIDAVYNYPKHRMNEEIIDLLEPYTNAPDYCVPAAKKVCGNVVGLLQWTLAMVCYFWTTKAVIPVQDNLITLEIKLTRERENLTKAENTLVDKERALELVQKEYDSAVLRKMRVQEEESQCTQRMHTARALVQSLEMELINWASKSLQCKAELEELGGDTIQIAAFLTYCGAFNQQYRSHFLSHWQLEVIKQQVPHRSKLDIIGLFTEADTTIERVVQALPAEEQFIQNAIITTRAHRCPLLIDPHAQGRCWLKGMYFDDITIISLANQAFREKLEHVLSDGLPLLIEDVTEDIHPVLADLIVKRTVCSNKMQKVRLGNREVLVAPSFKLFLSTHLANPTFPPEFSNLVTMIDFNITQKSLEDQLLTRLTQLECKDMEQLRLKLIDHVATGKCQLKRLQEDLLHRVVSCSGSLIEDPSLIEVLQEAKATAQVVARQVGQAAEAESEILQTREEYRRVAIRGTLLFSLMSDMASLNEMYHYGLSQFIELFDKVILHSESSPITSCRVTNVVQHLTASVWRFIVQSLYGQDRFFFTLMLAIRVSHKAGAIHTEELDFLINPSSRLSICDCPTKPGRWITDAAWLNLNALTELRTSPNIVAHVTQHERQWRQWFENDGAEEASLPAHYETELRPFTRLLLSRCWGMDRFLTQARRFISHVLGPNFTEDVLLRLDKLYREASPWTPIIGILNTGSDPTQLIEQLARKNRIPVLIVPMAEGQPLQARQAIQQAMLEGHWVLLQNCHLNLEYMSELHALLTDSTVHCSSPNRQYFRSDSQTSMETTYQSKWMSTSRTLQCSTAANTSTEATHSKTSDAFRLWITTAPHKRFPITLLRLGIKFADESPQGIRTNLLRTYGEITEDCLDACISVEWKCVLYALAFLHCTLLERAKYGPLGWAEPFDFMQTDFSAVVQIAQNHIDQVEFSRRNWKNSGIDWKYVRYMVAEIQYGGKLTDSFNLRFLNTLVGVLFQERMFAPDFQLAPNYRVPRVSTMSQHEAFIHGLPLFESPELLHLHKNAAIEYSNRTGAYIINCIQALEHTKCKVSTGQNSHGIENLMPTEVGCDRDSAVAQVCQELLSKLPSPIPSKCLNDQLAALGCMQPMTMFLQQEVERMNQLLWLVTSTLRDLLMAFEGALSMDQTGEDAMNSIYEAKVPTSWVKVSWDSSALGLWFSELLDRCAQLFSWLYEGRPKSFWLAGFFNPPGFLVAVLQEAVRGQPGLSLDCLKFTNRVTRMQLEDVSEEPSSGVYVHGLYLQGASWDQRTRRLIEARSRQLFDLLPVVNITTQAQPLSGFQTDVVSVPGNYSPPPSRSRRTSTYTNSQISRNKPSASETRSQYLHNDGENRSWPSRRRNTAVRDQSVKDRSTSMLLQNTTYEYSEAEGNQMSRVYIAPVYKKVQRGPTNLITTLNLACSKCAEHWTLRGVAVLGDFR